MRACYNPPMEENDMGMITRPIGIILILTACASRPEPERVSKERWVQCWHLCGKADRLVSATNAACYCAGGVKIIQDNAQDGESQTDSKGEPLALFKWLTE